MCNMTNSHLSPSAPLYHTRQSESISLPVCCIACCIPCCMMQRVRGFRGGVKKRDKSADFPLERESARTTGLFGSKRFDTTGTKPTNSEETVWFPLHNYNTWNVLHDYNTNATRRIFGSAQRPGRRALGPCFINATLHATRVGCVCCVALQSS